MRRFAGGAYAHTPCQVGERVLLRIM